MEAILSLDIGTTSMRGVLFSLDGEVLTISQKHSSPIFFDGNRVEQDPVIWKNALFEILSDISGHESLSMKGISVTAFRSPVFPIDKEGTPLAPAIMWQDQRTDKLCEELQDHEDAVFQKSGLKINSVFSGIKMRWYQENRPDLTERIHKYIGVQEYILYLLTGRLVTDHSLASRTNLFNLRTLDWDDELLRIFNIERQKLCELTEPGSICGNLVPDMMDIFGSTDSIPVISAGGDQQCASLGLGLVESGDIVVNTGTGSYVIAYSDQPVIDNEKRLFCNVGAIPGTYIIEAGTLASGTIYRWFSEELYDEIPDGEPLFKRIDREILESKIGSNGVLCLPHPTGRGAPYWNPEATGVFYGITLSTKRGDIARSILEGIVIEISENIDLIEDLDIPVTHVSVAGGMTKFDLYNQMQADAYAKDVMRYENQEATAVGAWISAVVALRLFGSYEDAFSCYAEHTEKKKFSPVPEDVDTYRKIKHRKQQLYQVLN